MKNKNNQAKSHQGHVKGVGSSNNSKKNEEKQSGENRTGNPCKNCGNPNHSTEACKVKPCEHCDSNNWFRRISRTHKTENCKNIQRIQEAKDNETRALRIQGEIDNENYGTDSDEGEMPNTQIGRISWAEIANEIKDDEEEEAITEKTGGETD